MSTMQRVSKAHPCPICEKPDWCLTGTDIVICMRVSSPKPKQMADGSVGYFHQANGKPLPPPAFHKRVEPSFESGKLLNKWAVDYGYKSLTYLSRTLGVSQNSLERIGCVKAPQHSVWGFPMKDGRGHVIGIRLRHKNGKKWCEPGGHNGLFIPVGNAKSEVVICEGPTDTAAALTIGLYAIGRFNCCGGIYMIQEFIRMNRIRNAIIVADCDQDRDIGGMTVNPGIQGAMALSEHLPVPNCTVTLPVKDMREFVRLGGTAQTFRSLVDGLVWRQP